MDGSESQSVSSNCSRHSRLKSESSFGDKQSTLFDTILGKSTESIVAQKPLYLNETENDFTNTSKHPLFGIRSDRHDSYRSDKTSPSLVSGNSSNFSKIN